MDECHQGLARSHMNRQEVTSKRVTLSPSHCDWLLSIIFHSTRIKKIFGVQLQWLYTIKTTCPELWCSLGVLKIYKPPSVDDCSMIFSSFIEAFPIQPSMLRVVDSTWPDSTRCPLTGGRSQELLPAEVRHSTGITREHFMNVIMEPRRSNWIHVAWMSTPGLWPIFEGDQFDIFKLIER